MLNKKQNQRGFTIIEVLIVLAIAGLILLIVFLAVPALQRNSRNTAIKNDVQNVLGGIGEFNAANGGSIPTSVSGTGTVTYRKVAPSNDTTANVQGTTVVGTAGSTTPQTDPAPAAGNIAVYLGRKCDGTANTRAVAVLFGTESSSATLIKNCTDS